MSRRGRRGEMRAVAALALGLAGAGPARARTWDMWKDEALRAMK